MNQLSHFYCSPLLGVLDLSTVKAVDELQNREYNKTHMEMLFRVHVVGKGFPIVVKKQYKNTPLGFKRCTNYLSNIRKNLLNALNAYNESVKQDGKLKAQ